MRGVDKRVLNIDSILEEQVQVVNIVVTDVCPQKIQVNIFKTEEASVIHKFIQILHQIYNK